MECIFSHQGKIILGILSFPDMDLSLFLRKKNIYIYFDVDHF